MNQWDKRLIAAILLLTVLGTVWLLRGASAGERLEITVDGEVFGTYALDTDCEIEIGKGNTCRIENGVVRMSAADCPDQLCVHHAQISRKNETIICLPNKVTLRILGGKKEEGPDTIVS